MGFSDRRRVSQLVQSASVSEKIAAQLRELPVEPLVAVVLDGSEPWWRRRACVTALLGRVPDESAHALLRRAEDAEEPEVLRAELLRVLATPGRAHSDRLLRWLQAQEGVEQRYQLDVALLKARAALHDVSAIPALCELATNDWSHTRQAAEGALDVLLQHAGTNAVLETFGAKTLEALAFQQQRPMAARLLGVRLLHRAGADVTAALGDSSVIVAQHAATLLSATRGDDAALWHRVHSGAPGALWALVVLHRRGLDVRDLRAAWRELGERQTDPRWILEAALLEPRPEPDEAALIARAEQALRAAGLRPEPAVSAGDQHQQGGGTYFTIAVGGDSVMVSTLGPFFSAEGSSVWELREAGFRQIDPKLATTIFEGLHVYFFGAREPLPVFDLLFYWQD